MKKFFLSTLLSALFVASVFSLKAQNFAFGIQASPSFSWMTTNSTRIGGSGAVTGLKLQLIAEKRIAEAYSITSGIGFHFNTGGKLRTTVPSSIWKDSWVDFVKRPSGNGNDTAAFASEASLKYNTTYVEIPFGLKMRTAETGNHLRYFAEPNIVLGFRSKAKGAISYGNTEETNINISKEVTAINLSWGIGGGAEYIVRNNTALVLGLYYQRGIVDMTSDNDAWLFDEDGKSNVRAETSKAVISSLTVRVGVMF